MKRMESVREVGQRFGILFFIALIVFLWVSGGIADQIYFTKPSNDGTEMIPLYSGYPESFHVAGVLDSIDRERVVIEDTAYLIKEDTRFNRKNVHGKRIRGFEEGNFVGLIFKTTGDDIDFNTLESVWWLYNHEPDAEG